MNQTGKPRSTRAERVAKAILWTLPAYFVLTSIYKFGAIDLAYFAIFASACLYLTVRHFKRLKGG